MARGKHNGTQLTLQVVTKLNKIPHRLLLCLAWSLCACSALGQSDNPTVVLLAGQSNMVGYGLSEELSPELAELPSNVQLFVDGKPADPTDRERFGPEVGFAHAIAEAEPDQTFILVKFAVGGTSLLAWAPEWTSEEAEITNNAGAGPLYKRFHDYLAEVPVPDDATFGGILWMQGERDARFPQAGKAYFENLHTLIEAFRHDTGEPSAPFILGRVNPPADRFLLLDAVRRAQEVAARALPGVRLVDTDDLTKRDDDVHYDSEGILELGRRFADAFLDAGRVRHSMVGSIQAPQYMAVLTSDLEASIAWYEQAFGLTRRGGSIAADSSWQIANLVSGELHVEIIRDSRADSARRDIGLFKVGFDVHDLDAVVARMAERTDQEPGIIHFEPLGQRLIQVRDPDGNVIQISERD